MGIILTVIDEDYVPVYEHTRVLIDHELDLIITKAEELALPCLAFADFVGDTFYNEKQMMQIKRELGFLKKQPGMNKEVLQTLEETIDFGLTESFYYLKLEGE